MRPEPSVACPLSGLPTSVVSVADSASPEPQASADGAAGEPGLLWAARRRARDVALVLPGERQAGECDRAVCADHADHAARAARAVRADRAVHEHEPRRSADRRRPRDDDEAAHRRQEHRDRRACRPGGPAPHPCLRQTSLRQQVVPLISGRRPLARSWADPGATDKVTGGSGAKMRLPRW